MRSQVLQFFGQDVPICKRLLPFPIAATLIGIAVVNIPLLLLSEILTNFRHYSQRHLTKESGFDPYFSETDKRGIARSPASGKRLLYRQSRSLLFFLILLNSL